MPHTTPAPTAPAAPLTPGAAADLAWLERVQAHHRRNAQVGERHEREGRARHPGR